MRSPRGIAIARHAVMTLRQKSEYKIFKTLWNKCVMPTPIVELADDFGIELIEYPFDHFGEALACAHGKWTLGISQNDHPKIQRFSIAHGLGHYMLDRHNPKCHFDGRKMNWTAETRANAAAAELLLPEELLREIIHLLDIRTLGINSLQKLSEHETDLRKLADDFKLSYTMLCWYLIDLKYITPEIACIFEQTANYSAVPEDDLLPF